MLACLACVPPVQSEPHAENDQRQAEPSIDLRQGHERRLRSMARPVKCKAPPTKRQPTEKPITLQPNEYPGVPLVNPTIAAITPIAMQAVEMRSSAAAEYLAHSLWTRSVISCLWTV